MAHKEALQESSLKDKSYAVWRMMQSKRREHERLVERSYHERARLRHETRH